MSLFRRFANLFRREKVDREIDLELRSHIEMRTDDNVAGGLPPEAARRDALLRFGNPRSTRERVAGEDAALLAASIGSDIRYALRQFIKNPGFAVTAILVLALGIGSSVAIFAFVDAALIKPLPYRDPSRLAALFESMTLGSRYHISYVDYVDWQRTNHVFSSLSVYDSYNMMITARSGAEHVVGAEVSGGFFRTLGVVPVLGRDFDEREETLGAPRTVLLSYEAWQSRFGGRAQAVGQAVTIDGTTRTVVGVLPRGFHFAPVEAAEFWTPLNSAAGCSKDRGCHNFSGVARLKDGVTMGQAAAEMKQIADGLAREYPGADDGRGATVLPLTELIVGDMRPILLALMAGAILLLLIACANVASLLLVRAESRKREIAVRGALGASSARLVRQLITEGAVLVAIACAAGLATAAIAARLLLALIPAAIMVQMPYLQGLGVNARVAAFAATLAILSALIFSVLPAMRLSRIARGAAMRDALTAGGRGFAGTLWRRFGANLVVVELATAVVLLACGGLLAKSFYRLLRTGIGFDPQQLVAVRVMPPEARTLDNAKVVAVNRELMSHMASLPGAQAAGTCAQLPVGYNGGSTIFRVQGRPYHGEHVEVLNRSVDENCFPAIGARILRGRNFTAVDDTAHPPVVIVNQAMVRRHFPGEDPIGKMILYGDSPAPRQIVGIVDDIKEGQLDDATDPAIYLPFAQEPEGYFYIVVRTQISPRAELDALADAIKQVDPSFAIAQPTIMSERIHDSAAAYLHRSAASLVGGFAALALLLSVVGLYGVISYSVSRRTREIGVRMALGAERRAVYALVVGQAARLTAIGLFAGLIAAIVAAMLIRKLLFGTAPWDPATLGAVAAVLSICALLSSFIPARRAASVNPADALRSE